MAYITGTVNASANPGLDLYALLAPALSTAGYTLVDTQVISTRTHKVWKSAAANNSATLDWFLDVAYPTSGTGNVTLLPMEFYDPATHLATRFIFSGVSNSVIDATTYSRFGASAFTLEDANWVINASNATGLALQTSTGAFGYWISVTGDRVAAITSVQPSWFLYTGMYTPHPLHSAAVGAAAYPLVVVQFDVGSSWFAQSSNTTAARAALTRAPKQTSVNWGIGCVFVLPALPIAGPSQQIYTPPPGSTFTQVMGVRVVSPIWVGSAGNYGVFGTLIGAAFGSPLGTITRGDTVTIGSDTWVTNTLNSSAGVFLLRAV